MHGASARVKRLEGWRRMIVMMALIIMGNGVADRLHKTVDQGGGEIGARSGLDTSGWKKSLLQCPQKAAFP